METLGLKLRNLRVSRNITQEQLAKELNDQFSTNINKSMISKWENDKEMPRLDYIRYAALYFRVSLDHLLGIHKTNTLEEDIAAYGLDRPEIKTLLKLGANSTKEEVETYNEIIMTLKGKGQNKK